MNSLTTKKKNGSTQPSESFGCFCSEIYVCGNQKVANQDQHPKIILIRFYQRLLVYHILKIKCMPKLNPAIKIYSIAIL